MNKKMTNKTAQRVFSTILTAALLAGSGYVSAQSTQHGNNPANPAQSAAASHQALGVLKAVNAQTQSVTITHEAIPSLNWPVMTMDFKLAMPELLKEVQVFSPNSSIRFSFEARGEGEFVITRIEQVQGAAGISPALPRVSQGGGHGGHH